MSVGIRIYRLDDLNAISLDIIALCIRHEYDADGYRLVGKTRDKIHWKLDWRVDDLASIRLIWILNSMPHIAVWDLPFLKEKMVRVSYGEDITGFSVSLQNLLASKGIKDVFMEEITE